MTALYIAANYVNGTDPLVGWINDGIGYGHLQIVYGANELEVQVDATWDVEPLQKVLSR